MSSPKRVDLRAKIRRADIVITGEGKLDRQTLAGKGPAGVARMARDSKAVYAIVGVATDDPEVRQLFDGIATLDDTSPGYGQTAALLETRARELRFAGADRSQLRRQLPSIALWHFVILAAEDNGATQGDIERDPGAFARRRYWAVITCSQFVPVHDQVVFWSTPPSPPPKTITASRF